MFTFRMRVHPPARACRFALPASRLACMDEEKHRLSIDASRLLCHRHVEDMDLFSINYMHWGRPKQWYCAPARSATLVEMVAAQSLSEQHTQCEHFLRHKTTLISPEVLMANGVPCCSLRQHPGEFIITFPRCYHFGFNFGLNCAESTNFALPVRGPCRLMCGANSLLVYCRIMTLPMPDAARRNGCRSVGPPRAARVRAARAWQSSTWPVSARRRPI